MEKIQIGIPCGRNCEKYVELLLETIKKTVSNLEFIEINDTCVNKLFLADLMKDFSHFKIIEDVSGEGHSVGHAYCLNSLLENMDSKFGMFIDCDVAMLKKNWDTELRQLLNEKNVVLGSEYDGEKYSNFPNVVFCIFRVDILKKLKLSFSSPGDNGKPIYITIDKKNKDIFGGSIGSKILLDTGWELPYKLKTAGYSGTPLNLVSPRHKSTHCNMKFMKKDMRGEEYQLGGVPICTHVGRSYTRPFGDPIVVKWRKRVAEWLRTTK